MKASYNWLKEFVDFPHSPEEIAELMTNIGLNIEGIDEVGGTWTQVYVGKVLTCKPVPETDHLSFCEVDAGTGETLGIVCGAPNVAEGEIVPVALVGARLAGGFKIKEITLRGVTSRGMICSERELGISEEHQGILVLPGDCRIGVPLTDYVGRRDWIFDVEVTINRPDCLSHLGMAREISAATGIDLKMPEIELTEVDEPASDKISIEILAPDKCPRYSARIVNGVKVAPSPLWMQDRLRNLGIRPISNVVDVTNYVLLELGHPLHAFDYHLITDSKIIVRTAEKGEKFVTLDEIEHTLEVSDLLITDPSGGIAIAGVMGGFNSEIKDDTEDVLLECAYFEPVGIRITSRDRGIGTESSYRFERGADPEMTLYAIDRAACLIQQFAGGSVLKGVVDNYPKPWETKSIKLRPERVNSLLATDIPTDEMVLFLKRLGCEVTVSDSIKVTTPSWRRDLDREIDLVEEIARLHGYDKVESAITSNVPLTYDDAREHRSTLIARFKQALVELGFSEAISPSLVPYSDVEKFPVSAKPVKLLNPLSEDMSHLRTNLAQSLLRATVRNLSAGLRNIRFFEWGVCFWMEGGEVAEGLRLAGLLTGDIRPETWSDDTRSLNIYDLKGLIEQFSMKISLDNLQFNAYDIINLIDSSQIIAGNDKSIQEIGLFGCLDPKICQAFDVEVPCWYFEFDGVKLLGLAGSTPQFKALPRYPSAHRDLAFLTDTSLQAGELEIVLWKNSGRHLVEIELFDLFSGKGIPKGKKSLAFHLTFRSAERTLSDAEVDSSVSRMVKSAQVEVGAVLRS